MSLSLISSSIDVYITISNFALFGLNKPPNRWKHINSHISKLWFCSYCFFEKLSSKSFRNSLQPFSTVTNCVISHDTVNSVWFCQVNWQCHMKLYSLWQQKNGPLYITKLHQWAYLWVPEDSELLVTPLQGFSVPFDWKSFSFEHFLELAIFDEVVDDLPHGLEWGLFGNSWR